MRNIPLNGVSLPREDLLQNGGHACLFHILEERVRTSGT